MCCTLNGGYEGLGSHHGGHGVQTAQDPEIHLLHEKGYIVTQAPAFQAENYLTSFDIEISNDIIGYSMNILPTHVSKLSREIYSTPSIRRGSRG
jgi:hypothetical protein